MTEAEWLVCEEPIDLLRHIKQHRGMRKQHKARRQRLYSAACCRRIWPLFATDRSRSCIEVAERFADGLASVEELKLAEEETNGLWRKNAGSDPEWACMKICEGNVDGMHICTAVVSAEFHRQQAESNTPVDPLDGRRPGACPSEDREQCKLIRDIFGNPFRPVTFLPAWRTSTVLALAQQMYESRDFSAMPILADALMDANCTDEAILTHCRGPGPHVRGCWVTDAILNKA